MNVIERLMEEHRVIKNTLDVFEAEIVQIKEREQVDLFAVETSIDFVRTYTDLVHQGKEDMLFRKLLQKKLADESVQVLNELIEEHKFSRGIISRWMIATEEYFDRKNTPQGVIDCLQELTTFYPRHLAKENKFFSGPAYASFTQEEQNDLIREFEEFELSVLAWKYRKVQSTLKERLDQIRDAST